MKTRAHTLMSSVIFSLFLMGCNTRDESPLVDPSQLADSLAALELAPAPPSNPAPATNPVPAVTPANPDPPVSQLSAANPSTSSTPSTAISLNPQHGQPGHRCDIAVGAPLPNAAANTVVPSSAQTTNSIFNRNATPQVQQKVVAPNTNSSLVRLNPKHGEPGHRCDIQVGAPLN